MVYLCIIKRKKQSNVLKIIFYLRLKKKNYATNK